VIAGDLTAQPDPRQSARGKNGFLGFGHSLGFAGHELNSASGTPRVAAAGVQLIDVNLILECQHESLAGRYLDLTNVFNG
jgi:hypothetical protein